MTEGRGRTSRKAGIHFFKYNFHEREKQKTEEKEVARKKAK